MVVHHTVKPAVPGSNSASPTRRDMSVPCWEASRVGMITAGWPLRGGRGKKIQKYQKNNKKKKKTFNNHAAAGALVGFVSAVAVQQHPVQH